MAELIAASVAARGVLFGNAHVASSRYFDCQHNFIWKSSGYLFVLLWFGISRWHTIRSPKLWQTEQSFRSNKVNSITTPYNILCNYLNAFRKFVCLFSPDYLYHTQTFSWFSELVFWSQSVHAFFSSAFKLLYAWACLFSTMLNSVDGIHNSTSILVNGITAVSIFIILTNQLVFDNLHFSICWGKYRTRF